MEFLQHVASTISPSFSDAISVTTPSGTGIFISGQLGVPWPPETGSVAFEDEVRITFECLRSSLGAGMTHVVNIKTFVTDLGTYGVYSRILGECFPKNPPTSTAVQVTGLLLNAKIEI